MTTGNLDVRADPALRHRRFTPASLRVLLRATETLTLAFGKKLGEMRASGQSFSVYLSKIEELEHRSRINERTIALLRARLDRALSKGKQDYLDTERWEIVRIRHEACFTQQETASAFLLSVSTIARWERELRTNPGVQGAIGSLIRPVPPIARISDAVRALIQVMALLGFGGSGLIARSLYRAGCEVSSSLVQNVLDEPPVGPVDKLSELVTPPLLEKRKRPPVTARRPLDVVMADVTDIPCALGGPPLKLFVFYDVFSRLPLDWRLLHQEPSAACAIELIDEVVERHGVPRYFLSDQGSYFTAEAFRERLQDHGITQRFAAIGQHGAIAVIERFHKTEKQLLGLPENKPLTREDILPRVGLSLAFYSHFRPHSSLGGRTPASIFYGLPEAQISAARAPRGRPGDPWPDLKVTITFLDAEKLFPVLLKKRRVAALSSAYRR
jgi:transposase InsO family protein/DNA-binding transcriptional regulator YiaG